MMFIKITYWIFSHSTCQNVKQLPADYLRTALRRNPEQDPADAKVCGAQKGHWYAWDSIYTRLQHDLQPLSALSTTDALLSPILDYSVKAQPDLLTISPTNKCYLQTSKAEGGKKQVILTSGLTLFTSPSHWVFNSLAHRHSFSLTQI